MTILKAAFSFICLLLFFDGLFSQEVKIITVPANVPIEEGKTKEVLIANLSKDEIYRIPFLYLVDNNFYLACENPARVLKMSPTGKIIGQLGREGQGPGEFIWIGEIKPFKDKIAIIESKLQKLVFYDKNLQYHSEFRFHSYFNGFVVDKGSNYIFYGNPSLEYYFYYYSEEGKFKGKFGKTVNNNYKNFCFDSVRYAMVLENETGMWACFKNRYDLRYYKNKKLHVEIKEMKGYFRGEEQIIGGRKIFMYTDRSLILARNNHLLYYIYLIEPKIFCDIFDLDSLSLLRRIKFDKNYRQVCHYSDNVFFGLAYDKNEDNDVLFFKIEL